MNDANPDSDATLQSAHRVLAMTEHEFFQPLMTIQQNHLRELQGGGGVTLRSGRELTPKAAKTKAANVRKVQTLVRQINALYGKLRHEVSKRFSSVKEQTRAMNLVQTLSTRLGNMVAFFARQLPRIRRLPGAVMEAVKKLPFMNQRRPVPRVVQRPNAVAERAVTRSVSQRQKGASRRTSPRTLAQPDWFTPS